MTEWIEDTSIGNSVAQVYFNNDNDDFKVVVEYNNEILFTGETAWQDAQRCASDAYFDKLYKKQ